MAIATIKSLPDTATPDGKPSAQRGLYIDDTLICQVSGPMGAHALSAIIDVLKERETTLDSFKNAIEGGVTIPNW